MKFKAILNNKRTFQISMVTVTPPSNDLKYNKHL